MRRLGTALAAALLACGAGAGLQAQIASPLPEGLTEGRGAPFPKGQHGQLDALPDWGGIWFMVRGAPGSPRPAPPKLKGAYKAANEAWRAQVAANNGMVPSERSHCSPPGMPMFMQLGQYPYELLFTPGRVTINQEAWMQTRRIWTDGRAHEADPDPSFAGESIGHWEGDTLVAQTIAINDSLPLGMGMTHSDKLVITERIHLSADDPDLLINEMVLTDPEALEEPYRTVISYRRDRHGKLYEFQCTENDRNPVDEAGQTGFE